MITFALDCSQNTLCLALLRDGQVQASLVETPPTQHSQDLLRRIHDFLASNAVAISDVNRVLYCHGPGSFTSLRIGLATLQGLFVGRSDKLHFLTGSSLLFRCLAERIRSGAKHIEVIMRAGRGRIYRGVLNDDHFSEEVVTVPEDAVYSEALVHADAFLPILANDSMHTQQNMNQARLNYLQPPDIG